MALADLPHPSLPDRGGGAFGQRAADLVQPAKAFP